MAKKSSCCCSVLPAGLWWLFSILGMLLLSVMMLSSRQGVVENDLQARTSQSLADNNHAWAEVTLDQRGRDVLLSGRAASGAVRDEALGIAGSVEGVRIVEDGVTVKPYKSPTMGLEVTGDDVVLTGSMPDQEMIDVVTAAAGETFGPDRVKNQMTVSEDVSEPAWLDTATGLLPELGKLENGSLQIDDKQQQLTGMVRSDEARQTLLEKAKGALGENLDNDLTVKELEPASFSMTSENGKLRLQGTLASQQEVDALVHAAEAKAGAGNVINELKVSEDAAPAHWTSAIAVLMNSVADDGSLSVNADKVQLGGAVESSDARDQIVGRFSEVLATSGLNIDDQMQVVEPEPVAETVTETAGAEESAESDTGITEEAQPEEQQTEPGISEQEKARQACQTRLDDEMHSKTILFATNSDRIRQVSFPLLDTLANVIKECADVIADKGVEIGGHTDSRGSDIYNMDLSQRRADSVKRYLEKKGVKDALLTAVGYGETQPVAKEDTPEGLAKNRRITFEIKEN